MAYDPTGIIVAGLQMASNQATNQINAERASSDMATYLNLIHKQREWQKEDQQWNESYAKRIQDYLYQNYNSPSAQMEAYKKAGLNPWLMAQGGDVGSGQSASAPSAPTTSHGSVSPFQRPALGNTFEGVADKLFGASSLANQRLSVMSQLAKSIPDLVKGVGRDASSRILKTLFGQDVSTRKIDAAIDYELESQQISNQRNQLELDLRNVFGVEHEQLINQHLSSEIDKLKEQVLSERKGRELSDAQIDELVTRAARNLAEKAHLEANTETINKMREIIYYQSYFEAKSAKAQASVDAMDKNDRYAKYVSENAEREALLLQGKKDSELTPSERVYKKSAQFWKRLGNVVKNVSPLK